MLLKVVFKLFQRNIFRPLLLISRNNHSQYIITNESNGTREITLNNEKTK